MAELGLMHWSRKPAYSDVPWVQIPLLPPNMRASGDSYVCELGEYHGQQFYLFTKTKNDEENIRKRTFWFDSKSSLKSHQLKLNMWEIAQLARATY